MSYDTTGPVKVNETKSLLLLILLVVLVGGGIGLALHLNKIPALQAPSMAATASAPAREMVSTPAVKNGRPRFPGQAQRRRLPVRPDGTPEGISHPRENVTLIRSKGVYVSITTNNRNINVSRSRPANDHLATTLSAVQRIVNDAKAQKRYDATPEQVRALKALTLKTPQFSSEEQKTITTLFKAMEAAKPEERPAAEKALIEAVGKMPVPEEELKAFEEGITEARDILRADQLDLIDNNM